MTDTVRGHDDASKFYNHDACILLHFLDLLALFLRCLLKPQSTYFLIVSCLCWNDGILVTASWDSTVKVRV